MSYLKAISYLSALPPKGTFTHSDVPSIHPMHLTVLTQVGYLRRVGTVAKTHIQRSRTRTKSYNYWQANVYEMTEAGRAKRALRENQHHA